MPKYEDYQAFRTRLNKRILERGTLNTRRFFTQDARLYEAGALDRQTKELMGLVASMVLRCDDCIAYHVDQCVREGMTDLQLWEAFDVALVVGGSIVIPHLRRAVDFLAQCREHEGDGASQGATVQIPADQPPCTNH